MATECVQALCLLPLSIMDLHCPLCTAVSASDASEQGGGVTIATGMSVMGSARLAEADRAHDEHDVVGVVLIEPFGGIACALCSSG